MKRIITHLVMGWLSLALTPRMAGAQSLSFVGQAIDLEVKGIACITVFDLDCDGDGDIIGGAEIPGRGLYWWRNDGGDPLHWERFPVDAYIDDAMSVEVAYIDNDTFPDIVATELYQGQIDWWQNSGDPATGWTKRVIGYPYGAHDAMCADINADGHTDVVGVSSYPGSISVFYNDGAVIPGWTEHAICDSLAGTKTVTIQDIDRDGDLDVIGAAEIANTICWWENLGGYPASWEEHIINSDFAGAQIAVPVLMDGDSLYDIIAAGAECQEIAYWLCQDLATNQWIKHIVTDQLGVAVNVRGGDLDGDGDLDIVAVGMIPGELLVFRNDSFSWAPMVLRSDFGRGWALEVDDIDQDGDLDIIAGAEDLGDLFLWENMPDFRPHMTPYSISIMPGGTESVFVSIDSHNDYHGTVKLSAAVSPEPGTGHVSLTFNPMYINPSGSCSLTVVVSTDMAPGQYAITVIAADSVDTLKADSTITLEILGSGQAAVIGGDHAMMELVRGIWGTVDSLWDMPPVIGPSYQALVLENGAEPGDTSVIRQFIEGGGRVLLMRKTPFELCGSTNIMPISGWVGASGYGNYSGSGIPIISTYDHPFGVSGIQVNDTLGSAVLGFGRLSGLAAGGVKLAQLGSVASTLAGVYCSSGSGHCLYYTGGAGIGPQSDSLIKSFLINPALGAEGVDAGGAAQYHPSKVEAWPNPHRERTTIRYSVASRGLMELRIYDILGRPVRIVQSGMCEPGAYTLEWDGKNSMGQPLSAGIYFIRLSSRDGNETRKIVKLK
ncbi:MAG: T9SS type A sorting domain-containing protein [Candidatus Edwardsbacteria bacterium]|nr:T9SS type A sorting domain-containing protein [Candidatus Edwardsbacteria bacterium]